MDRNRALLADTVASAADDLRENSYALLNKIEEMEFRVRNSIKGLLEDPKNYIIGLETAEISSMSILVAQALKNLQQDEYPPIFIDFYKFIKVNNQHKQNWLDFPNILVCKVDIDEELEQYSEVLTSWAGLVKHKSKKIIFIMKNSKYLEQSIMKIRTVNVFKLKFTELWEEMETQSNEISTHQIRVENNESPKTDMNNISLKEESREDSVVTDPMMFIKLHGIELINAMDKSGNTPLHSAAQEGQKKLVNALLACDAKVEAENRYWLKTPLHLATEKGHYEIVNILLKNNADVNAAASGCETPLYKASCKNDVRMVNLLLKFGAKIEKKTTNGNIPLHQACQCGHNSVVNTLLEVGSNINAQNNNGNTPLHYAIQYNKQEVVLNLLQKGADVKIKNRKEENALDLARKDERTSNLIEILECHANLVK